MNMNMNMNMSDARQRAWEALRASRALVYQFAQREAQREEIARILETIAQAGLPGPSDLDVALDAIFATFDAAEIEAG